MVKNPETRWMNIRYDIKDSLLTLAIIVSYFVKRKTAAASDKKANNTTIHLIFWLHIASDRACISCWYEENLVVFYTFRYSSVHFQRHWKSEEARKQIDKQKGVSTELDVEYMAHAQHKRIRIWLRLLLCQRFKTKWKANGKHRFQISNQAWTDE